MNIKSHMNLYDHTLDAKFIL